MKLLPFFHESVGKHTYLADVIAKLKVDKASKQGYIEMKFVTHFLAMRLRVGITYNLKKDFAPSEDQPIDALEEFDPEETIDAIQHVLEGDGHDVVKLGGDRGLIDRLKKTPVDIVFNIAEGHGGRNREAHIPALLEFLGHSVYGL